MPCLSPIARIRTSRTLQLARLPFFVFCITADEPATSLVAYMSLEDQCREVELILADVDGVLTDGGIVFDNEGIEIKRFHVRDGLGVKLWRKAGFQFGILTARTSHIVKLRATELGVDVLRQGFEDKLPAAQQIASELGLEPQQICYVGDDLPDLPVMRQVGLAVAVTGSAPEVCQAAHYITQTAGGEGAIREAYRPTQRERSGASPRSGLRTTGRAMAAWPWRLEPSPGPISSTSSRSSRASMSSSDTRQGKKRPASSGVTSRSANDLSGSPAG